MNAYFELVKPTELLFFFQIKRNVPQRTYAYYESGGRMLPPQVLCALADFYNVSVDYLLGRTDKKEVNR